MANFLFFVHNHVGLYVYAIVNYYHRTPLSVAVICWFSSSQSAFTARGQSSATSAFFMRAGSSVNGYENFTYFQALAVGGSFALAA